MKKLIGILLLFTNVLLYSNANNLGIKTDALEKIYMEGDTLFYYELDFKGENANIEIGTDSFSASCEKFFCYMELANELHDYNLYMRSTKILEKFFSSYKLEDNQYAKEFLNKIKCQAAECKNTQTNDSIYDKNIKYLDIESYVEQIRQNTSLLNEKYFFVSMIMAFKYDYPPAYYCLARNIEFFFFERNKKVDVFSQCLSSYFLEISAAKGCVMAKQELDNNGFHF